jgi:hypothetical protein
LHSFHRKYGKLLITTPITAHMTGDLLRVALAHRLAKGIYPLYKLLIALPGFTHRHFLLQVEVDYTEKGVDSSTSVLLPGVCLHV